jgi:hypothetical protein
VRESLTESQLVEHRKRLHFPTGYAPAGRGKVRAACHCGWTTTPRVDRRRAFQALLDDHGYTGAGTIDPSCGICGYTMKARGNDLYFTELRYPWEVFEPLMQDGRPYVTPAAEGQPHEVYVCRDRDACHARHEALTRADRLKCGCYQSSVMAIGHYHQS